MAEILTSEKLFSEIVKAIDPSEEEKPAYEFSNGRKFVQPEPLYRSEEQQG